MDIQEKSVVSLRHFSTLNPITSVVAARSGKSMSLLLPREFVYYDFEKKDPASVIIENDGKLMQTDCTIKGLSVKNASLELETTETKEIKNTRHKHRYPVSLYTDIMCKKSNEKFIGRIKNISSGGFMIQTKDNCENRGNLELDMHLGDKVVPVQIELKRKNFKMPDTYEYGVAIQKMDTGSKAELMSYLEGLNKQEKDMLSRLKKKL
jgi:hypothetical protein